MKPRRILLGLALVAGWLLAFTPQPPFLSFKVWFDAPTNELDTNSFFNLYNSTVLSTGLAFYQPMMSVAYTNSILSNAADPNFVRVYIPFTTPLQQQFIFQTESNALSGLESAPGLPPAGTPPIPFSHPLHLTR